MALSTSSVASSPSSQKSVVAPTSHDFSLVSPLGFTAAFFFVTGGVAIGGARSGNTYMVVLTMVMAIISATYHTTTTSTCEVFIENYEPIKMRQVEQTFQGRRTSTGLQRSNQATVEPPSRAGARLAASLTAALIGALKVYGS